MGFPAFFVAMLIFAYILKNLMNKLLVGILGALMATSAMAEGCMFNWSHYGDNQVRDLLEQQIGDHVPNKYCPYTEKHSIVIQTNAYTMRSMCVGHATAFIRPRNSNILHARTFSSVVANTDCTSFQGAVQLAVEASLSAVDSVMAHLDDYVK